MVSGANWKTNWKTAAREFRYTQLWEHQEERIEEWEQFLYGHIYEEYIMMM